MYKIYIRQPWDVQWQVWREKSYLSKWTASLKVLDLKKEDWVTDKTEFLVSRTKP